ncbi:MAG TPA: FMN-binding negative transcriptional regulator [Actinomycetales bacterium]|nr:FMN-binding negative transcriptional regulator [Actinomycetales bacterium]
MFVPPDYRPLDPQWARETVRRYPLAMLITNGAEAPFATHLPIIPADSLDEGTGETGLVGVSLLGHMNRLNPHWAALAAGRPGLLVFQGPNAYVSPTVYQTTPAAPTWNFTAVHLHGTPEPIESRDETLHVVKATVTAYERDHGTRWDMTDSIGYFKQIVPGVGAFRFRVTAAEGMFKLSQEKSETIRQAVADSFASATSGCSHAVADTMCRFGIAAEPRLPAVPRLDSG